MAQHDYVIANGTGAAVRSDLNNALSAIVTQNSGSTEPTTIYAYQMWADTNAGVMKIRNGANSAWITLYQLDGEWTSIAFENGSAAAPSIYFKDSGTDTGFFSGGTDQVNIATAGTERVEWGTSEVVFNDAGNNYDFRVEGDTNANLLFVDASADAVGVGTSSPTTTLDVAGNARLHNSTSNTNRKLEIRSTQGYSSFIQFTEDNIADRWSLGIANGDGGFIFKTGADFTGTERLRITSAGNVGIGTTEPAQRLEIQDGSISVGSSVNANTTNVLLAGYGYILSGTKYGNTSIRSTYNNATNLASLEFYTSSGTTASTERARIDSSGRLLVGTSTSYANADVDELQIGNNSSATKTGITLGSTDQSGIAFADASDARAGLIEYTHSIDSLRFYTNGASNERLRIANNGQLSAVVPGNSTLYPGFMARVWINFDGTSGSIGTGRASGNVSSVTDNGTGDYTINFSTAMPDTNYCVVTGMSGNSASSNGNEFYVSTQISGPSYNSGYTTTSSIRMLSMDGSGTNRDAASLNLAVFR